MRVKSFIISSMLTPLTFQTNGIVYGSLAIQKTGVS